MSSRTRIGVVEAIAHPGGAQYSLLELVRRLRDDFTFVIILPEEGPLRLLAEEAGAEVHVLNWPSRLLRVGEHAGVVQTLRGALELPAFTTRLRTFLEGLHLDLVITNGVKPHIVGTIAGRRRTIPIIWYLRDGLEGRRTSTLALRVLSARCSGAIAISNYVAREANKSLPARVPVAVIYNIVDLGRFHATATPPSDLVKQPGEVWFTTIGALTPLKGQDLFLAAAREVARDLPSARFLIVGSNFYPTQEGSEFAAQLQATASGPELSGRVWFLGQRADIPGILRMSDVVVQPNRGPEALGRSVLEAMACEVPVIASDRWGPAELIEHGVSGLLTPVRDVDALARSMCELGRNGDKRRRIGLEAGAWVRATLEADRLVNEFRAFVTVRLTGLSRTL